MEVNGGLSSGSLAEDEEEEEESESSPGGSGVDLMRPAPPLLPWHFRDPVRCHHERVYRETVFIRGPKFELVELIECTFEILFTMLGFTLRPELLDRFSEYS